MKPFMAIERHMTVMGGLVAVLAVGLVARVCNRASGAWRPALAASAVIVLAAPPAFTTIAIARSTPHDTRSMIERLRAALDGRDAVDWYASFPAHGHYPPLTTVDGATEYVVLVEETANRFVRAGTFPRQSERVRGPRGSKPCFRGSVRCRTSASRWCRGARRRPRQRRVARLNRNDVDRRYVHSRTSTKCPAIAAAAAMAGDTK
jgi:hypothetical protein